MLDIKIPLLKGFMLSAAKVSLQIKQRFFSTSSLSFTHKSILQKCYMIFSFSFINHFPCAFKASTPV